MSSLRLLSISGGPGYLLPGWLKATGSEEPGSFLWAVSNNIASCALRASGQQVARTTQKIIASAVLWLLLVTAPLAHAQSNDANSAPSAPVSVSPPPPYAGQSAPVPPQATSPNGSAAPSQDDITDIRPPIFFLSLWLWFWIALALVALIALLIFLWKWLSKPAYLSPKSAYDLTLEKLEKARTLLREDDPVPYAIVVSEAIRSYLGQRFQTPSTRRTTEEFLRMMEVGQGTPLAEHSDLLRQFLQACDLVKFARYQPTQAELEAVQQRAFSFVHATNPALIPTPVAGGKP